MTLSSLIHSEITNELKKKIKFLISNTILIKKIWKIDEVFSNNIKYMNIIYSCLQMKIVLVSSDCWNNIKKLIPGEAFGRSNKMGGILLFLGELRLPLGDSNESYNLLHLLKILYIFRSQNISKNIQIKKLT